MVNALAYASEEGRVKLRKAAGSCTKAQIRRYPNGATHLPIYRQVSRQRSGSQRGELKHLSTPRNRKQVSDSPSSGERTGPSPNRPEYSGWGCRARVSARKQRRSGLESRPTEGDRPVDVRDRAWRDPLSTTGPEKSCGKLPAPSGKATYCI